MRELSKRLRLFKTFFISFSALSLIVAIMFGLSIAFYPGGNLKDNDQEGFSIIWNTMCELGGNTSINGESNRLSQVLYRSGLTLISIIVVFYFSIIWIFFQEKKKTKIMSIIGSFLGTVQGGIYIGIAFTGGNLHMILLIIAPLMEFFAILPYAIIFLKDERVPKLSGYTFLVMFSFAILYSIMVIIGQIVGEDLFLLVRHFGHTLFNFLITLSYAVQGIGTYKFMKNLESNPIPS